MYGTADIPYFVFFVSLWFIRYRSANSAPPREIDCY